MGASQKSNSAPCRSYRRWAARLRRVSSDGTAVTASLLDGLCIIPYTTTEYPVKEGEHGPTENFEVLRRGQGRPHRPAEPHRGAGTRYQPHGGGGPLLRGRPTADRLPPLRRRRRRPHPPGGPRPRLCHGGRTRRRRRCPHRRGDGGNPPLRAVVEGVSNGTGC